MASFAPNAVSLPKPSAADIPKLLTAPEVARILDLSPRTVYSLAQRGLLPVRRYGRSVRFSLADVVAGRRR